MASCFGLRRKVYGMVIIISSCLETCRDCHRQFEPFEYIADQLWFIKFYEVSYTLCRECLEDEIERSYG